MNKNEKFQLVGHLQVMDEPLSSLYMDSASGQYYLFVRLFEDTLFKTFILTEVTPHEIVDYMEGRVGLRGMFGHGVSYYYKNQGGELRSSDFKLLTSKNAYKKLESDGLDDRFDRHLSYKMIPLKEYLKTKY